MKKFLLILLMGLMFFASNAQKILSVNGSENSGHTIKTTDSAYHYVDSVVISANEAGIIEVSVIGFSYDTAYSVTGVQTVRYNKHRDTLTMGTPTDVLAKETDTVLGSATFDLISSGNKIYVRIKGKLNYTMRWLSIVKRKSVFE